MIQSVAKDDASEGVWDGERNARTGLGRCCSVKVKKRVGERLVPLRALRASRHRLIAVGWRLIVVIGGATGRSKRRFLQVRLHHMSV